MVEFELFQGSERAVALLGELEAPAIGLAEVVEAIAARRRVAQEGTRDEDDRDHGEHRAEDECKGHATAAPAA
jgi:hypothetical protein